MKTNVHFIRFERCAFKSFKSAQFEGIEEYAPSEAFESYWQNICTDENVKKVIITELSEETVRRRFEISGLQPPDEIYGSSFFSSDEPVESVLLAGLDGVPIIPGKKQEMVVFSNQENDVTAAENNNFQTVESFDDWVIQS